MFLARLALATDLTLLLLLAAVDLLLVLLLLDDEALDLVDDLLLPLLLPLLPPRRAMIYSSLSRLDIHSTTER